MSTEPLYLDATMLYRWRHLAPVGIVRLERLLAEHLRRGGLGPVELVIWDAGYRPADDFEIAILDELLSGVVQDSAADSHDDRADTIGTPTAAVGPHRRGVKTVARRAGLRAIGRLPEHLRPFAEQAGWASATLAVESVRHIRRSRQAESPRQLGDDTPVVHRCDFSRGGDLVALGLGWEYLNHAAMYRLKEQTGIRIHMPAFDLIPVVMPQMNAGQSAMVHQYYAEMAHYADTITSISHATTAAMEQFYELEQLPVPALMTNQVPTVRVTARSDSIGHRFGDTPFVLSVSTIEIRKNHVLLAKIWAECIAEGIEMPKLLVVGRIGWDVNEFLRWVEDAPGLSDAIELLTDVDDPELDALYRDCLFTVFPSRIEGWGMPIGESLAYGKACVHSTDPAQREASQGLMPALHPDDFQGWKAEIRRLIDDEQYRTSLEQLIADEYRPRSVAEYCSTYQDILAERRGPKS